MILVDHSEYVQSAEGLKDANIISIIDHHGDGSVTTGNPIIYDARPIGATATIVEDPTRKVSRPKSPVKRGQNRITA